MKRFLLIALCGALLNGVAANADSEIGRIALVNGDVRIAKDETDKGRAAKPNDAVFNTDVVKTGDSGTAKILFTDQSLMDVGPSSALKVSNFSLKAIENRTGTFSILYGKIRALVTKKVGDDGKVEVRSGDAVMGVRGTEFLVEVPRIARGGVSSGTQLVVVSGLVQVRPPQGGPPIAVGAGQLIVASVKSFAQAAASGGPGGGIVQKVSAEQMQTLVASSTTQSTVFELNTKIDANGTKGGDTKPPELPPLPPGPPPPPPPPPTPPTPPPPPRPPVGNPVHITVNVQ